MKKKFVSVKKILICFSVVLALSLTFVQIFHTKITSLAKEVEKAEKLGNLGVFAVPVLEDQEFENSTATKKGEQVLASYDLNEEEKEMVESYTPTEE